MSVLPFLVVASVAGALSLVLRSVRPLSTGIALLGLLAMVATGSGISAGQPFVLGGMRLLGSDWVRLYALLGSLVGLGLVVVDVTALHEPDAPGVIVLGLGAAVLALSIAEPSVAVAAATAAGLIGILAAAPAGAPARAAAVGGRALRALAVAGALAIGGFAWLGRPLGDIVPPALLGIVYLAVASAVAIRFGAIPFHVSAARLADSAPGVALPLLLAWLPAAFAAVVVAWIERSLGPLGIPLPTERGLIAAIGAATVVLGLVAAWIQDDLEHVVGYTIVGAAGYVVVALAVLDPAVGEPTRTWLLSFAVASSALAGWVVAVHGGFGTRRLPELGGWIRRAPVLGISLALIGLATIGLPMMTGWSSRAAIAGLALPAPLSGLAIVAPLGALAVFGRILLLGVQPMGPAVRDGRGERPAWPRVVPAPQDRRRRRDPLGGAVAAVTRPMAVRQAAEAVRANVTPLASIAVLALAVVAVVVSAGGFGVRTAAGALPAEIGAGPSTAVGAGTSAAPAEPRETSEPVASGTMPELSFEPLPSEAVAP